MGGTLHDVRLSEKKGTMRMLAIRVRAMVKGRGDLRPDYDQALVMGHSRATPRSTHTGSICSPHFTTDSNAGGRFYVQSPLCQRSRIGRDDTSRVLPISSRAPRWHPRSRSYGAMHLLVSEAGPYRHRHSGSNPPRKNTSTRGRKQIPARNDSAVENCGTSPLPFTVRQLVARAETAGGWIGVEKILENVIPSVASDDGGGHDGRDSLRMYATAMEVCAKCGKWRKALELLDTMRNAGVAPDCRVYGFVMLACEVDGQWDQSIRVWKEIEDICTIKPSVTMYGYAMRAYANLRQSEKAVSLLREMQMKRLTPDAQGFAAAIMAHGHARRWRDAMYVFMEMKALGVSPSRFTYRTGIVACGNSGQWEKAVDLLAEMKDIGLAPDVKTYNTVLSMCCRNHKWEETLSLFLQMKKKYDVKPDTASYDMAVWACGQLKNRRRVLNILAEMRVTGVSPRLATYNRAIFAFCTGDPTL